ncbi:hypothetical protein Vadar_019504 [Vaccinium darrowii]|uniref:Uncharacterized protein n=1 Tax=Vaccinium darrowii TaxID=229202 RepID=A0ACB7XBZ0_9ERIC|nr:hypothetical protein Vadar_019504 [Vaccinium darrowii]
MDRSWMLKDRRSKDYEDGVESFLNFAIIHAKDFQSIRCPCIMCGNLKKQPLREIKNHLFCKGIDQSYQTWTWHREPTINATSRPCVNEQEFFHQEVQTDSLNVTLDVAEMIEAAYNDCTTNPDKFKKLLEDAEKPLYPGCTKYTKLSALENFFNFKAGSQISNLWFSNLLKMFGDMLPISNELPSSMYEAGKTFAALGMEYEKIHACPFDCVLYRKELKDETSCPTCQTSRWKLKKNSTEVRTSVPAKVLWYFSPIPRFRKMYNSIETAENLTWHANERESDGLLRHPADSLSWKLVDNMWPDFAAEPRNLRLALSTDGINPHRSLSSVEAYDAYRRECFSLKAVLLWTINDLPAFGNLNGCKVKGFYACPVCGEQTCSHRLKHGKKIIYRGHRRFLSRHHLYRKQKKAFNGEQENREPPVPLSGEEVLRKVEGIETVWGKKNKGQKSRDGAGANC